MGGCGAYFNTKIYFLLFISTSEVDMKICFHIDRATLNQKIIIFSEDFLL